MIIDQAIYTSARTARLTGYQLVAVSPGVTDTDARELAAWGPSHDSLLETGSAALSVNFMPLPSGAWCVSQSTPEGPELSGRGGSRVYTQALIASPAVFQRFACNPFALWRAALAQGAVDVLAQPPERLKPIELLGHAATVDETLLGQLARDPGAAWLAELIDAVLGEPTVGVAAGRFAPKLVAGLMSSLPPCCRGAFSFSTGLRYSSSRPFRLAVVPDNSSEQRRLQRQFQMRVVTVGDTPPTPRAPDQSWGGFVFWVLSKGRLAWFARQLREQAGDAVAEDLPALAARLYASADDLESTSGRSTARRSFADRPRDAHAAVATERERFATRRQRADASHSQAGAKRAAVAEPASDGQSTSEPADDMAASFPRAAHALRGLQDALFEALAGKDDRLAELPTLWREAARQVGPGARGELRERFLRFTIETWRELGADNPAASHRRAAPAMEILELLTVGLDGSD